MLINYSKIKVIINGSEIFPIARGEKLVIPVFQNNPRIVATDGYHITQPLELVFHHIKTYHFKIICVIDNSQLAAGLILTLILFLLGLLTGVLAIMVVSIMPIMYFLFLYYINKKDFIQICAV